MRAYYFTEDMERNSDLQWEYLLQLYLASYKKTVLKKRKHKTTNNQTTKNSTTQHVIKKWIWKLKTNVLLWLLELCEFLNILATGTSLISFLSAAQWLLCQGKRTLGWFQVSMKRSCMSFNISPALRQAEIITFFFYLQFYLSIK